MPYEKIQFNPQAAPGISADRLNHMQTQYEEAAADLSEHELEVDPHPQYARDEDLMSHLADNAAHNAVRAGDDNKNTQEVKTLLVETDTRSVEVTRTSGQITGLTVKDPSDSSTVESVIVNRASGQVSSIVETVGARTITITINRTSGQITSITKAVV